MPLSRSKPKHKRTYDARVYRDHTVDGQYPTMIPEWLTSRTCKRLTGLAIIMSTFMGAGTAFAEDLRGMDVPTVVNEDAIADPNRAVTEDADPPTTATPQEDTGSSASTGNALTDEDPSNGDSIGTAGSTDAATSGDGTSTTADAPLPDSGTWGSCAWTVDGAGVLTIGAGTGADIAEDGNAPWSDHASQITGVKTTGRVILPQFARRMFYGMTNLTDISGLAGFDASNVESLHSMFYNCSSLTDLTPLSGWSVQNVQNLGYMFTGCVKLQSIAPLVSWRLPKAFHLQGMFQDCYDLTDIQATADWGLADKVIHLGWMFRDCHSLSDISSLASWKITNVQQTAGMFQSCPKITSTAPLKDWKTSSLRDMKYMFYGTSSSLLTDLSGLESWDVSHVTDMSYVFLHQPKLADLSPLASWNTTSVVTMRGMFNGCSSLVDISALRNWTTGTVTDMESMFQDCSSLSNLGPLSGWDVSHVMDIGRIFQRCVKLTDISPLSNWKTSSARSMMYMFYHCGLTSLEPLSQWDVGKAEKMMGMFQGNTGLISLDGLESWDVSSLAYLGDPYVTPAGAFSGCTGLTDIGALSNWNVSSLTSARDLFYGDTALSDISPLSNWKTTSLLRIDGLLLGCSSITDVDALAGWDVSKVWTMWGTFYGCTGLTDISGISRWDTSSLRQASIMFYRCPFTDINALKDWDMSHVTHMSNMFIDCSKLTDASASADWDLTSVSAPDSSLPFKGCTSLELVGVPTPDRNGAWLQSEYSHTIGSKGWTAYDWAPVNRNLTGAQVQQGYTDSNATITDVRVWRIGVQYWGTCPWWLDDGGTLHINDVPGVGVGADVQLANSAQPTTGDAKQIPWWPVKDQVRRIVTSSTVVMPSKSCNLFQWMPNLTDISGLSKWDASHVTNMSNMFRAGSVTGDGFSSLKDIDALSRWDVSNVTTMDCMFWGMRSLEDVNGLSKWNTASLQSTRWMFQGCAGITSLEAFSDWDVSNVTMMVCMFEGANGITSLKGLENWDTRSLTSVASMFSAMSNVSSANPTAYPEQGKINDVSALKNWDMSHVTQALGMLAGSQLKNLDDLKGWDMSSCSRFEGMFTHSPVLEDTSAIAGWRLDETALSKEQAPTQFMFRNCPEIIRAGVPAVGHGAAYVAPQYPDRNWTDEDLPITPLGDSSGIYPYMESNDEDRVFTDEGGIFIPYQPVYIVTFDNNEATKPGDLPGRQWAYVDPTGDQTGTVDLPVDYQGAKTGSHFVGWSTSPDGSTGVIDPDGSTWRPTGGLSTGDPSKIVLYAVWAPNLSTAMPSTGSEGLVEALLVILSTGLLIITTGRSYRPKHKR